MSAHWVALIIAVLFEAVAARPALLSPSSVSITSGSIPTVSPSLSPCPSRDNALVLPSASDRLYVVECGTDNYGGDIQGQSPQHVEDFDHCLKVCDALPRCIAVSFNSEMGENGAYFCYPKDKTSTKVLNPKFIGASFQSRRAPPASSKVSAQDAKTVLSSGVSASSTSTNKNLPTLSSSSAFSSSGGNEKSTRSDSYTAPEASSGTLSSATSSTVATSPIIPSSTLEPSMESMASSIATRIVVTNTVSDATTSSTLKASGTALSMPSMPSSSTLNLSTRLKIPHVSTGLAITSTVSDATTSSTLTLLSSSLSTLSSSSSGIPIPSTWSMTSSADSSRSTVVTSSSSHGSGMTKLPLEVSMGFTPGNGTVPASVSSHVSTSTSLKPSRTVSTTSRGPTDFAVTLPPKTTTSIMASRYNSTVTRTTSSGSESTVVTLTLGTHPVAVTLPAKTHGSSTSLSSASISSSVAKNTTSAVDLTSSVTSSRRQLTTTLNLPQASSTGTVTVDRSTSVTSVTSSQPEFTAVTNTYRINRPGYHFTETHTHTYSVVHWNASTKAPIPPDPTHISSTGPRNGAVSSTSTVLTSGMVNTTALTFTHNSLNSTISTNGSMAMSSKMTSSQPEYTTVTDTYRVNRSGYHFTKTHTHTYPIVHWNASTESSMTTSSIANGSAANTTSTVVPSNSVHWMSSTTESVISSTRLKMPDVKATVVPTISLGGVSRTTSTTGSAAIISSGGNSTTLESSRAANSTATPFETHVFTLNSDYTTTTTSDTGIYGTSNEASGTGTPVPATNVITSASATGPLPTVDGFGVPMTPTSKSAPTRSYGWNRPSHTISKTAAHRNSITLSSPTVKSHNVVTSSSSKGHLHSIDDLTVVLSFTESGRNFTSTHRKTLTGAPTNMKPYQPRPTSVKGSSIPSGSGPKWNLTVTSSPVSKPTVFRTVTRIDPNVKSVFRLTATSTGAESTWAAKTQPVVSSVSTSVVGPTQGPTLSSSMNSTSRHVGYSKTTHSTVVTSLWPTKSTDHEQSTFTPSKAVVTKSSRPGSITGTSLLNGKSTSSPRPATASNVSKPFVKHACDVPVNDLPLDELLRNTFHVIKAAGEKFYKVNNGDPCPGKQRPNWQSISSVLPKDVLSMFRSGKANFFKAEGDSVYYVKIRDGDSETITPVLVDGNYYLDEPEDPACKACFGKNVKNLSTCNRKCKPVIKQLNSLKEIEIKEHWTYNAKIGKITVDGVEVLTTVGIPSSTERAIPSHVTVVSSTTVVSQAEAVTTTVSVKASTVTLSTEKIVSVTETISGKDGPTITIVPSKTTLWAIISYHPKVTTSTLSLPVVTNHEKLGIVSSPVTVPAAPSKSSINPSVSSIPAPSVTFVTSSRTVTYSGADSSSISSSSSSSVKSSSNWLGSGSESIIAASHTLSDSSTTSPSASPTTATLYNSSGDSTTSHSALPTVSGGSIISPSASPTKPTEESTFIPGIGWRKVSPTAAVSDAQPIPHSAASGTKISGTFAMGVVAVVGFFLSC